MDNDGSPSSSCSSKQRGTKINFRLLPIKAHYFFFMASMGPILPFLNVFGKQLGVSEVVMGSVTAVLPILFLLAKPMFGLVVDYFQDQRKVVFMTLLCATSVCYVLLYFIPHPLGTSAPLYTTTKVPCHELTACAAEMMTEAEACDTTWKHMLCNWTCGYNVTNLLALVSVSINESAAPSLCALEKANESTASCSDWGVCDLSCSLRITENGKDCLYGTPIFWGFVLLMSLGTIGFNVANSISDAICFDMLGSGSEMGYGHQRVWGTIGFGVTALLAGFAIDWWSAGSATKDYTPAFIVVLAFAAMDLLCCIKLKLPPLPRSENILRDIGNLLKHRHIVIFLIFATLAGVTDSFIIYFLFWYLEDLALATGTMDNIKLLEGVTIAVETLVGEVIFFLLSGKILQKIGYGHSLTLCFLAYSLRLGLISLIPSPWWVIPVELFMQGPTYAMSYTTIVAYASAVSPPGTSATMQGLVAGMDDGFGYAMGSMIGGLLYHEFGGSVALKMFCGLALACGILHFILYELMLKHTMIPAGSANGSKYKTPHDAALATEVAISDKDKSVS